MAAFLPGYKHFVVSDYHSLELRTVRRCALVSREKVKSLADMTLAGDAGVLVASTSHDLLGRKYDHRVLNLQSLLSTIRFVGTSPVLATDSLDTTPAATFRKAEGLLPLFGGTGGIRIDRSTAPHDNRPPSALFPPDTDFVGRDGLVPIAVPTAFQYTNPHHVAQYAVFMCMQGKTAQLLREMGHVEKDQELGRAFLTFLREFGPDLERFKGRNLHLKFQGYAPGGDTSVWYYTLVTADGKSLERKPWISLHRSKKSGKCALTGIFLNAEGDEVQKIPDGLVTSAKEEHSP